MTNFVNFLHFYEKRSTLLTSIIVNNQYVMKIISTATEGHSTCCLIVAARKESMVNGWAILGKSQAGVTLVEMMAVVAIIAAVSAFAIPNYQTWNARVQLKEALVELNSNLSMARMAAMNRNTTITATIVVSSGRVNATFTDPTTTSANCLANTSNCMIPTQLMPGGVTQVGGTTTFQFNSLGLRVGGGTANQEVALSNRDGLTYAIQVSPAGRTRWCTSATCP